MSLSLAINICLSELVSLPPLSYIALLVIVIIAKDKDIINLESGTFYVEHNGNSFKVEESYLYGEDYADFNSYTLRRVSSFDV